MHFHHVYAAKHWSIQQPTLSDTFAHHKGLRFGMESQFQISGASDGNRHEMQVSLSFDIPYPHLLQRLAARPVEATIMSNTL